MSKKHTPGPWHVVGNVPAIASDIGGDNPAVIARIEIEGAGFVFEKDYEVRNANAALIAAAPDMLEALKVALIALGDEPHSDFPLCTSDDCAACKIKGAIVLAEPNYFSSIQTPLEHP
jgi:hypothetical protein